MAYFGLENPTWTLGWELAERVDTLRKGWERNYDGRMELETQIIILENERVGIERAIDAYTELLGTLDTA